MASNEQLFLKQQQHQASRSCKLNDAVALAAEQTYNLINHYPSITEHQQQFTTNELDGSNAMSLVDQRFDATFLKMLDPKVINSSNSKSREKQVFSPIGYSRDLAVAAATAARETEHLQQLKFNYQSASDCQRFMVNNADALKALQQHNSQVGYH